MKKGMELEIHNPIEQEILKECELQGQEPDALPWPSIPSIYSSAYLIEDAKQNYLLSEWIMGGKAAWDCETEWWRALSDKVLSLNLILSATKR